MRTSGRICASLCVCVCVCVCCCRCPILSAPRTPFPMSANALHDDSHTCACVRVCVRMHVRARTQLHRRLSLLTLSAPTPFSPPSQQQRPACGPLCRCAAARHSLQPPAHGDKGRACGKAHGESPGKSVLSRLFGSLEGLTLPFPPPSSPSPGENSGKVSFLLKRGALLLKRRVEPNAKDTSALRGYL